MSGNESDDAMLDRRSYLSGSLAALGALSLGVGAGSAGDRKTRVTGDDDVTKIDSCTTITEPGFYALSEDLQTDRGEACIEIRSDHVLLDGKGHRISGNHDGTGVLVQPTAGDRLTTVTVSNLSLEDLETGIYFDRVREGLITDVEIDLGAVQTTGIHLCDVTRSIVQQSQLSGTLVGVGIDVEESQHNAVLWNTLESFLGGIGLEAAEENWFVGNALRGMAPSGLSVVESDDNTFFGNAIVDSNIQLRVIRSSGNRFGSNTFRDSAEGLSFYQSDENAFVGNRIQDMTQGLIVTSSNENLVIGNAVQRIAVDHGIRFEDAHRNKVAGNVVLESGMSGILLTDSTKNELQGNATSDNGGDGVTLVESDHNKISRTTATGNGGYGIGVFDSDHTVGRGNFATDNLEGPIAIVGGTGSRIEVNGAFYEGCTSDETVPERVRTLQDDQATTTQQLEDTSMEALSEHADASLEERRAKKAEMLSDLDEQETANLATALSAENGSIAPELNGNASD